MKFKQAKEFQIILGGYRNSYCLSCKNAESAPLMHAYQEEALKAARKHRTPWSGEDILKLAEMAQKGLSGPTMAIALNRSVYAVYTMKRKIQQGDL